MRRFAAVLFPLLLSYGPAFAQGTPMQGGPWAPGHVPMYTPNGGTQAVVQDSGPASGGAAGLGLSELLLMSRGTGFGATAPFANAGTGPMGSNLCDYDGPTTGPYHYLCISPNTNGQPSIIIGSGGGAPLVPMQLIYNGQAYQFPFNTAILGAAVGGDLSGTLPNPTVSKINGAALPVGIVKGVGGAPAAATSGDLVSLLGYTPLNKTGDIVTGTLTGPAAVYTPANSPGQFNLYTSPPANYTLNAGLPLASYYPIVGGNSFDNTRASNYIGFTTVADAGFFESGLVVNSHLTLGQATPWKTGTAYTAGTSVLGGNGASVYTAQNSGTSGATQPACSSGTCSDGVVTWQFRQVNAYYGKAGSAFYTVADVGGPLDAWGTYENFQTAAGAGATNAFAHEIDVTNRDIGCNVGARSCYGLFIGGTSINPFTAAIALQPSPGSANAAYHFGMLLNGSLATDTVDIDVDSSAPIGLAFDFLGVGANHATATIQDKSTSPTGYDMEGSHTTGINLGGTFSTFQIVGSGFAVGPTGLITANNGISLGGSPATGINDTGTHTTGINLGGTYSGFQIAGTGWGVGPAGALTTAAVKVGSTTLISSSVSLTNGAAAQTATITNGPTAGNPTKWIPINDNGTTRYIPAW